MHGPKDLLSKCGPGACEPGWWEGTGWEETGWEPGRCLSQKCAGQAVGSQGGRQCFWQLIFQCGTGFQRAAGAKITGGW